ncbi:hypothetical protein MJO28_013748 [Puccinia striiformis f. sp. tritici]|uniref:Uncharacterized protein n=1 Tax=Puccinia striiformis f. sp. tritici TaxID=168172 RepID=A0ACC0DVN4_9BASI|nr:hypothetical protein MJO28_013748 [Puccinia striiformis f. sp. tritici]
MEPLSPEDKQKLSHILKGKGVPDLATRQLADRLSTHEALVKGGVCTYIVTDADPYGYAIAFCYKYGSHVLRYYEGLISRDAIRIGVSPRDWDEFAVDVSKLQQMSAKDYDKLKSLLDNNQISDSERSELELFKEGKKSHLGIILTTSHVQTSQNVVDPKAQLKLER